MPTPASRYLLFSVVLLAVELCIGFFVHDQIIRPYGGDLLVVILLYCLVKAFFRISVLKAAIGVLVFACLVETLQAFHIADRLGFQHSKLAQIIIGSTFEWSDMLVYTFGIGIVLLLEARGQKPEVRSE